MASPVEEEDVMASDRDDGEDIFCNQLADGKEVLFCCSHSLSRLRAVSDAAHLEAGYGEEQQCSCCRRGNDAVSIGHPPYKQQDDGEEDEGEADIVDRLEIMDCDIVSHWQGPEEPERRQGSE